MKRSHTAIAIISDPKSEFDVVDAGRAAQNMTLVAWELGIGSVFISGPEPPERVPYRKKAKQLLGFRTISILLISLSWGIQNAGEWLRERRGRN